MNSQHSPAVTVSLQQTFRSSFPLQLPLVHVHCPLALWGSLSAAPTSRENAYIHAKDASSDDGKASRPQCSQAWLIPMQ